MAHKVDIVVNDLWSGDMVNTFTSDNHSKKQPVTAVCGLSNGMVLFSGGHHHLATWNLRLCE